MSVILCTFITAAIRSIIFEKTVKTVGCFFNHFSDHILFSGMKKRSSNQNILRTPWSPVTHGFILISHPPEVCGKIRSNNAAIQF